MRWQPSLQIIPHYESNPLYIEALVKSINKKIGEINWKPDLILASYHGIPKKYFDKGDPRIIVIVIKLQDLLMKSSILLKLKRHSNQDLDPRNGCNLIQIKL